MPPPAATTRLPPPRVLTLRRVVVTALFAAAILGGAMLGVFLAFESDLPQVTSLEEFQPNIITQMMMSPSNSTYLPKPMSSSHKAPPIAVVNRPTEPRIGQ